MINSSLLFFIIIKIMFLCIAIDVLHIRMCMCRPGRSTLCGKWFLNERISRSSAPCSSPPLYTAPRAAHRDATATAELQTAVGPGHAKRGATCTYLKACSSSHCSYYSNSFRATQGTVYTDQYLPVTVIIVIYTSEQ